MTDLISRADAIEAVCRTRCGDKAKGCPAHSCLVIEEFDALPSAETHEIRTETHAVCLISKDDAMGAVQDHFNDDGFKGYDDGQKMMDRIKELPSADIPTEDYSDLPDIPRAYYEKIVGNMSHEINMLKEQLESADAVQGYTEWLEKIIVDAETIEWLCEDTPCKEWCDENCHYKSIQAECLRHLYEVSKGGDDK